MITDFLQNGSLFGFLYKEKNPGQFNLPKMISHITQVNISPKPGKAKLFVNFLHKLYQKYVKQDVLNHRHHFSPFYLQQIQNVSKKVVFKKFGLFLLFVWPSSFRKRLLFIRKTVYNVKVHETLIAKWCCLYFHLQPFRRQACSCKTSENQKNGAPCGPRLQKYCMT